MPAQMGTVEEIVVLPKVLEAIKGHCRQQKDRWGAEAVGFMAQKRENGPISTIVPLNNHAADPTKTYFVEPWEQFRAEETLKAQKYIIAGVYHSHPSGEAQPSRMDADLARPGELMLIYSVYFDNITLWRETGGRLVEARIA